MATMSETRSIEKSSINKQWPVTFAVLSISFNWRSISSSKFFFFSHSTQWLVTNEKIWSIELRTCLHYGMQSNESDGKCSIQLKFFIFVRKFTSSCSFCFDLSWHWSRMPLNSSKFIASPIFFLFLFWIHVSIYSANHTFRTFKHSTRLTTTKINKIRDKTNVCRTALKTQLALCWNIDKTQVCYSCELMQ